MSLLSRIFCKKSFICYNVDIMVNIWVKGMIENKIVAQKTMKMQEPYSRDILEYMIKSVMEQMDLPSPIVIYAHFSHFEQFKTTKFLKRDFVESIPFDYLEVVDIS